jgi:hypothetical protein
MLEPWVFIALLLGAGMLLPGVAIVANWLLSPKKPNAYMSAVSKPWGIRRFSLRALTIFMP